MLQKLKAVTIIVVKIFNRKKYDNVEEMLHIISPTHLEIVSPTLMRIEQKLIPTSDTRLSTTDYYLYSVSAIRAPVSKQIITPSQIFKKVLLRIQNMLLAK